MRKRTECVSSALAERYVRVVHPSGLSVYVFPKKMTTAYALFAVNYGSVDTTLPTPEGELPLPDGVAHFLEHKLFEDENGEDAFAAFSAYGADVNAYTTYGRTAYLFSTTAHFEECLRELLKFVTQPHFTEESVEREKGIIGQEIRMYEDHPWECAYRNMLCALYRTHPVRRRICGTQASIAQITPDLLLSAYRAYYRLSNMALIVCGDVEEETVLAVTDEVLGHLPACEDAPARQKRCEKGGVYKPSVSKRMQVAKPIFCIGIKDSTPTAETEEERHELCMSLLCEILFSQSGRFYERLYEEELLTSAFSWEYSTVEGVRFLCLSGDTNAPEAVLSRLHAFLEETGRRGIDAEEFERARRMMYANEVLAYDSTEEIANNLLSCAFEGRNLFEIPSRLMEITKEELDSKLSVLLRKENFVLSTVLPFEENGEGANH